MTKAPADCHRPPRTLCVAIAELPDCCRKTVPSPQFPQTVIPTLPTTPRGMCAGCMDAQCGSAAKGSVAFLCPLGSAHGEVGAGSLSGGRSPASGCLGASLGVCLGSLSVGWEQGRPRYITVPLETNRIQTQNLWSTNRVPLDKLFNFSPLVREMEQEICCEIPNEQCSCLTKFRTMFKVMLAAAGPAPA